MPWSAELYWSTLPGGIEGSLLKSGDSWAHLIGYFLRKNEEGHLAEDHLQICGGPLEYVVHREWYTAVYLEPRVLLKGEKAQEWHRWNRWSPVKESLYVFLKNVDLYLVDPRDFC